MMIWLSKLAAYLPAIAVSVIAYYFLQRGEVLTAAILTTCASVLALCAILFRESEDADSRCRQPTAKK